MVKNGTKNRSTHTNSAFQHGNLQDKLHLKFDFDLKKKDFFLAFLKKVTL
jgi:hypothetical protein